MITKIIGNYINDLYQEGIISQYEYDNLIKLCIIVYTRGGHHYDLEVLKKYKPIEITYNDTNSSEYYHQKNYEREINSIKEASYITLWGPEDRLISTGRLFRGLRYGNWQEEKDGQPQIVNYLSRDNCFIILYQNTQLPDVLINLIISYVF